MVCGEIFRFPSRNIIVSHVSVWCFGLQLLYFSFRICEALSVLDNVRLDFSLLIKFCVLDFHFFAVNNI